MQELSLNILDIAENSVKAGAALVTVGVCYRPAQDRLTVTMPGVSSFAVKIQIFSSQ